MTICFRKVLLAGAATMLPATGFAQDGDLAERVATLEAMVEELKSELASERAETDEELVRLEAEASKAQPGVQDGSAADGYSIGDTRFGFGGFVDLDAHVTHTSDGSIAGNSIARDFHIPSVTPIGGEESTVTDFTAQASRFFFTAEDEVAGQNVSGRIELDFLGSLQGNERVSNSYSPRLRHAYLDVGNVRVGQTWSTFQNTSAIPESASFLVLSDGMVFIRQPQVRYTLGNWQFALENGDTTVTPVGGGRIEADTNTVPDLVARYNARGAYGNVSFAALGRQLRIEDGPAGVGLVDDESAFGWGLSASGRINLGERDDLRFNLVGGEGTGRYVGLNAVNGAAIDPADGSLEAIPSYGGLIAWRHPFGETARFNLGYSGLFTDNPSFLPGSTTKQVQSVYGALLWDIAPGVTMGGEVLYGMRETEAGAEGEIARFTFSTKYAF